jgi:hypothetical protein
MRNMWLRTLNNLLELSSVKNEMNAIALLLLLLHCLYFQLQSFSSIGADEIPITNSCSEQDYFAPGKRLRTSAARAFRTSRDVQFEAVMRPQSSPTPGSRIHALVPTFLGS